MKILVISPHPKGFVPSQRLKYEQYFEYFQENGIQVEVSPFISEQFQKILYKKGFFFLKFKFTALGYLQRIKDIFRLRQFDGIYIHLYVTPFGFPIFEWIYCFIQPNFVYDIDDLIFSKRLSHKNPIAELFRGTSKIPFLTKRARHVITCTPFLDEYARKFNKNTTDISSTINTEVYLPNSNKNNSLNLVLGWSGSHSTAPYLYLIENVLHKIQLKYNVKVLVIGEPAFTFSKFSCEAIEWNKYSEIEDLKKIDIGLYPLPDEKWVLGKSGLKALQYMALGIPTVATAIGANFRVIEDGVSGFLVQTEEQWYSILEKLILKSDLREEIGKNARIRVEKLYSIKANRDIYLNILLNSFNKKIQ
jgi:glycosyltransferase involved in cell wall biosynthesis